MKNNGSKIWILTAIGLIVMAAMLSSGCIDNGETKRIKLVKNGGQAMIDGLSSKEP